QHSVSKDLKRAKKFLQRNKSSLFLISLGLVIFLFGGVNYYRVRILSFTKTPQEAKTILKGELPTEINIPSIGVNLPIEVGTIKDNVWQVSYIHPTFLDTSARPGTNGNIVIYGHNKKIIFGNLPYLSLGQKIYIKTTDNKIYTYVAYKKDFVSPERVDLV